MSWCLEMILLEVMRPLYNILLVGLPVTSVGLKIFLFTVYDRGLFAITSVSCVPWISAQSWIRLAWFRDHRLWINDREGHNIIFSVQPIFKFSTYFHLKENQGSANCLHTCEENINKDPRFDSLWWQHIIMAPIPLCVWQKFCDWYVTLRYFGILCSPFHI